MLMVELCQIAKNAYGGLRTNIYGQGGIVTNTNADGGIEPTNIYPSLCTVFFRILAAP